MIVKPTQPPGMDRIRLANGEDFLVYPLAEGTTYAVVQLDASSPWTPSAVVTVDMSLNGSSFVGFATPVTFSDVGAKILEVTGVRYLRVYVSTPQTGSCVVIPTVTAGRDV